MSYKVLIPSDITSAGKEYLWENGCEVTVLEDSSVESICRNIGDMDAVLARTEEYPARVFKAAKKLKVISRYGSGVDNIDLEAASAHGVQICNTPIANANSVAEHTVMLILACAKKAVLQDKACRRGDFASRNRERGIELEGKCLGIIGCGNIGRMAAQKMVYGFGMRAVGYDEYVDPAKVPDCIRMVNSVDAVYEEADFISLHVPLTEATKGMVGREALGKMKKDAYVINCARGGLIDEEALYEAVSSGQIAGAGLDVFESEILEGGKPLDADSPLFTLDQIVVSPHNAALTVEACDRMGVHAAQGILEVLAGKEPAWPVNQIAENP